MSGIEEIYKNYVGNNESARSRNSSTVTEAEELLKICLSRLPCKDDYLTAEELISKLMTHKEMQGFISGFRYSAQLANECFCKSSSAIF